MSWYYCNKCVRVYEGRDDGTDVVHPPCRYAAVAVDARERELEAKLRAAEEKAAALDFAAEFQKIPQKSRMVSLLTGLSYYYEIAGAELTTIQRNAVLAWLRERAIQAARAKEPSNA